MAANNPTIKKNATSLTVVGGTDAVYTETSKSVPGGVEVSNLAIADMRVRESIECKNRNPVLDSKTGVYTKRKTEAKLVFPVLQPDGSVQFEVWRITAEITVGTAAADLADRRYRAGQVITAAAFDNLWNNGSMK